MASIGVRNLDNELVARLISVRSLGVHFQTGDKVPEGTRWSFSALTRHESSAYSPLRRT